MRALEFILYSSCAYMVIMGLKSWYFKDNRDDKFKKE